MLFYGTAAKQKVIDFEFSSLKKTKKNKIILLTVKIITLTGHMGTWLLYTTSTRQETVQSSFVVHKMTVLLFISLLTRIVVKQNPHTFKLASVMLRPPQ